MPEETSDDPPGTGVDDRVEDRAEDRAGGGLAGEAAGSGALDTIARLPTRLAAFDAPDTGSQREGTLEPGEYQVDRRLTDQGPDSDTDYAHVVTSLLGDGETWICTRWRDQVYAVVETRAPVETPEPADFAGDELAIPEIALIELLPGFHDFRYDLDQARYPMPIEGVNLPISPPETNNCCTFVEGLVVKAWQNVHGDKARWSAERHGQMMIFSADDYFSPITALCECGIARAADPDAPPSPWSVVQGWRRQWRGGHTFLIVDHHRESDRVLTLESNSSYRLDGCGYRNIGNLRDHPAPPAHWWRNASLWTWAKLRSTYRHRQVAALKVVDRSFSGIESAT